MKRLAGLALLSLASCAAEAPVTPQGPVAALDCDAVESRDWAAWVNAMPGPNSRPTLIVTGKVTVPTGGYRIAWGDFRVMESYPIQVVAELRTIRPTGYVTEAHVTHDVRGEWPIEPPLGAFTVRCGDMVLARIAPVETAH